MGDTSFDPLRMDQQRLLYRKCFVPGSLNGGFNASNPAFDPKTALVVQQASGYPTGHVGADDANAFAIDACDGRLVWVSSDVDNGRLDAAIVSGMLVQLGSTRKPAAGDYPYEFVQDIQIVGLGASYQVSPPVLATVELRAPGGAKAQPSLGGGGVAIAGGKIYAPTTAGVVPSACAAMRTARSFGTMLRPRRRRAATSSRGPTRSRSLQAPPAGACSRSSTRGSRIRS